MDIEKILAEKVADGVKALYGEPFPIEKIIFQQTNPEFEGDITLVAFPFLKLSKKKPEETAGDIGNYLKQHCAEVKEFNCVKGFLNLVIFDAFWLSYFSAAQLPLPAPVKQPGTVMVEYCGPNTNKPLHLGHVRNMLLGWSVIKILEANGNRVIKANIVNDRGIHICKSMLAWQKWGNGETPGKAGMKGDHFIGKYYVLFDKKLKEEKEKLRAEEEKDLPLMKEAQELLRKWEAGDKETIDLWKKMNAWVYEGFEETFKAIGVSFDKIYYESDMYKLGKKVVEENTGKVFIKRSDGAVVADLKADNLDEKVLLRSDGTSVYITQDIATAVERVKDYPDLKKLIYTVANEQEHHFKVLFRILKKLGYDWADNCYHLSYGMVELPEGKMKSREGTVVDADDLVAEMISEAKKVSEELGKWGDMSTSEKENLYRIVGLAALKYFILKVDPKKKMLFNPKESIDFNGNTGPFIQYTYARIRSIFRKGNIDPAAVKFRAEQVTISKLEKDIFKLLYAYPAVVKEAGKNYSPALVANFSYELACAYNAFYHDIQVLKEEDESLRNFRLALSAKAGEVIKHAMCLLGIEVPERM